MVGFLRSSVGSRLPSAGTRVPRRVGRARLYGAALPRAHARLSHLRRLDGLPRGRAPASLRRRALGGAALVHDPPVLEDPRQQRRAHGRRPDRNLYRLLARPRLDGRGALERARGALARLRARPRPEPDAARVAVGHDAPERVAQLLGARAAHRARDPPGAAAALGDARRRAARGRCSGSSPGTRTSTSPSRSYPSSSSASPSARRSPGPTSRSRSPARSRSLASPAGTPHTATAPPTPWSTSSRRACPSTTRPRSSGCVRTATGPGGAEHRLRVAELPPAPPAGVPHRRLPGRPHLRPVACERAASAGAVHAERLALREEHAALAAAAGGAERLPPARAAMADPRARRGRRCSSGSRSGAAGPTGRGSCRSPSPRRLPPARRALGGERARDGPTRAGSCRGDPPSR